MDLIQIPFSCTTHSAKFVHMQKKSILICDDDPDIVSALEAILSLSGYDVCKAHTGFDCMACLSESTPDLILLDLMLPDIHGSKLAENIRAIPAFKNIPIVVISASKDIKEIVGQMPVQDHIEKPFELAHLLQTVSKYTCHN